MSTQPKAKKRHRPQKADQRSPAVRQGPQRQPGGGLRVGRDDKTQRGGSLQAEGHPLVPFENRPDGQEDLPRIQKSLELLVPGAAAAIAKYPMSPG